MFAEIQASQTRPHTPLTDVVGRCVEQQAGDLEVVVRQRSEDRGVFSLSPQHLL